MIFCPCLLFKSTVILWIRNRILQIICSSSRKRKVGNASKYEWYSCTYTKLYTTTWTRSLNVRLQELALNEWGESASHQRLFNQPVLVLKARHSVIFIFLDSVCFILSYYFLNKLLSLFLRSGMWLGAWGWGGGGGGGGCLVWGRFYVFNLLK